MKFTSTLRIIFNMWDNGIMIEAMEDQIKKVLNLGKSDEKCISNTELFSLMSRFSGLISSVVNLKLPKRTNQSLDSSN